MQLEVNTLLVVNVTNVTLLASTLPFIMGRQLSDGASNARRALMAQALGWMAMIASGFWPNTWIDRLLSTVSMSLWVGANWLMFKALCSWLGPRPLERWMWWIMWITPVGYCVAFGSYPFRVGWANFLLAAQMVILAWAARRPLTEHTGRWRTVFGVTVSVIAFMTAGRGVLGAFFWETYPYFTAPHPFNQAAMLLANVALVLLNVTFLIAWREEAELLLQTQVVTDPLTGLLNRRGWLQLTDGIFAHAVRHHQRIAILALDLDHFKRINDQHGHEMGDAVLQLLGRVLREGMRKGDVLARVGGEEFLIMLPEADEAQARAYDQRLRQTLLTRSQLELGFAVNVSAGLALLPDGGETLDALISRADEALYRAKDGGRARLSL